MPKRKYPSQTEVTRRLTAYVPAHPEIQAAFLDIEKDPELAAWAANAKAQLLGLAITGAPALARYAESSGVDLVALALLTIAVDADNPTEAERQDAADAVSQILGQMKDPASFLASALK